MSETSPVVHPPIRSFRRRGRMTPGRKLRWEEHSPRYCIEKAEIPLWSPTLVDIGFGSGESVLAAAQAGTHGRILGVEVHEAGITHLITDLAEHDLNNVRVVRSDIMDVLSFLAPGSIHEMCIFFPDPWPKAGHAHRRLVRPDVIASLIPHLAPLGMLRLATDAEAYASQMVEVCDGFAVLRRASPPKRVSTKYERLGRAAGRVITDLAYVNQGN